MRFLKRPPPQSANTTRIPLVNLAIEYQEVRDEILKAISNVLEGTSYILGKNVGLFEQEYSSYVGSKYGVGVASGTDALVIALRALGISRNDEVITVSHTFVATVDAVTKAGAIPVLVDIDERTYNIDASKVVERITKRTKAILAVHMYGQPSRLDELREICDKHNLALVQDACQAHGATLRRRKLGEYGDVLCYSFYPSKDLGAYGDAGMIVTDSQKLAEKCRMLRNYGQSRKYHHDLVGYNSRMDEIQAACLRVKLRYVGDWIRRRRTAAQKYSEILGKLDRVIVPFEDPECRHSYYLYVVRVPDRDFVRKRLARSGIETGIHYPIPVHLQKSYPGLRAMKLPITEKVVKEIISLPMHPYLTSDEQSDIFCVLKDMVARVRPR